ncbi:hypothetical protein P872_09055 [Rhodonellum psychrophilum GCM71 = DSM 17998]|uniref:Secretion system C-terminal sorting domain-containing protein n=2 Tax=Rhodonellum TaxID=336827 RepID=U5BZ92_9BACT|nr:MULTISPECIES: T9SS type A sorting domain-containing protein [Rhodonellum]ERM81232.1 hypothetical protein P872_09055 [Rhodonellum psychrophilum GCM71 = DSM 17998]
MNRKTKPKPAILLDTFSTQKICFNIPDMLYFYKNIFNPLLFTVVLACFCSGETKAQKVFFVNPSTNKILVIDPISFQDIAPGDSIILMAGTYSQILIRNLRGDKNSPIVIVNKGGPVVLSEGINYGIAIRNSKYLKIIGKNSNQNAPNEKGISIRDVSNGNGISLEDGTSQIEISGIGLYNIAKSGIMAKSDSNCQNDSFLRENFIFEGLIISNCVFDAIGDEGMYIGSSFYHGRTWDCDGGIKPVLEHLMQDVKIHDNILNNIGKDAIQVSSTPSNCQIFNNRVTLDSQEMSFGQMSGILIGGGSVCEVFNNFIADGMGSGIEVFGNSGNVIYNNVIVNPGSQLFPESSPQNFPKHGIYVKNITGESIFDIRIFNNTLIAPKTSGINSPDALGNKTIIQNNVIVNPGVFPIVANRAFIDLNKSSSIEYSRANLFSNAIDSLFFESSENYDFRQTFRSPLINSGLPIAGFDLNFDHDQLPRPKNGKMDMGAFEYQEIYKLNNAFGSLKIYPNPSSDYLNMKYLNIRENAGTIALINTNGVILFQEKFQDEYSLDRILDLRQFPNGLYILKIDTKTTSLSHLLFKN